MKVLFTTVYVVIFGLMLNAQTYEIRIIGTPENALAVQLRSTSGTPPSTANRVQDLIFGIKWPQSCGLDIDIVTPTNHGFNIVTSGTKNSKGNYFFRAFGADPNNFTLPTSWTTGAWTTVYTLQSNRQGMGFCDFEICEVGFDATLTNQTGPNLNFDFIDYTPTVNGAARIALPIELLNFQAEKGDKVAYLTWQTATETNNQGFQIERSANGITFENIGFVKGVGHSTAESNYTFTDEHPLSSGNYYRLRQMDTDGKETISKVVSVFFDVKTLAVNISPNPFHDNVILAISTENKAVLSIDVRDVLGRLVQHFTLNTEGVVNLPIATKDWPSGAYFINVADGQTTVQQKIVKN